ncbi:ionotropic receptor 75a-like [Episyrphus balteatus]|uniref:ionotropic receptor 75a-like n=1 Tax=Episyrphus balteatus TaxID=286459 RepID=UPI002485D2F1|nr:ionotropic receptor 75a-like [Episyrphus balteatus]
MKSFAFIVLFAFISLSNGININLISNFTVNIVKTQQVVLFGCSEEDLLNIGKSLINQNRLVLFINLKSNFSFENALTRYNHVRTSVILDCTCSECTKMLRYYSGSRSFNKTYQWMIWDVNNYGLSELEINEDPIMIGPNAQLTFVNSSEDGSYSLYDVHSKGRHINAPLEVTHYGDWNYDKLIMHKDIFYLQGIQNRGHFNGLQLRGVVVIDRDNITTDEQIHKLVTSTKKEDGLATFIKYHYQLIGVMKEHLQFTVKYRNVRSWSGRLRGGPFRLGFLGVVKRNEVDIGASSAFKRINRFADYDNIHMSWKFDATFLYRFTSDIDADGASGDFLAPFVMQVWVFSCVLTVFLICVWYFVSWYMRRKIREEEEDKDGFLLKTFAALCQQGLDPVPKNSPSRLIVLTLFIFSLMMYNFYTSSVVGGLLNSSERGPKTVAEIVNSPLKLSFEDIGYHKVLFKNITRPIVQKMYDTKVRTKRGPNELPVFTHTKDAVPFLKKGGYAFHCERKDAYPEIARLFDANEICELRIVAGLLETEILSWFVVKNSIYTELFRITLCRIREVGIIKRTLIIYNPEKPQCQASYTVYPVALSGVSSAFFVLGGSMLISCICLAAEIMQFRIKDDFKFRTKKSDGF